MHKAAHAIGPRPREVAQVRLILVHLQPDIIAVPGKSVAARRKA